MVAIVIEVCALAVPVTFSEDGEKVHAAPAGSPEQARVTVPVKPLLGARLNITEAAPPEGTVKVPAAALSANVPVPGLAATAAMEANNPSLSWFRPAAK